MSTSEQKPTTITWEKFMERGNSVFAAWCDENCEISFEGVIVTAYDYDITHQMIYFKGGGHKSMRDNYVLTVEWLQPAAGMTEAQGGEENELTALRAENARLREALEPFAKIYSDYGSYYDPYTNLIMYIVENIDNEVLYTAMKNAYEQLPTGDK